MTFLVPDNMSKVAPLSPPASEDELRWWKSIRNPIAIRQWAYQAVPLIVLMTIIDAVRGRIGFRTFVVIPLIGSLFGLLVWAFVEKHHRNRQIRWKRMREELGLTTEELPSTAPDTDLLG